MVLEMDMGEDIRLEVLELGKECAVAVARPIRRPEVVGEAPYPLEHLPDLEVILVHRCEFPIDHRAIGRARHQRGEEHLLLLVEVRQQLGVEVALPDFLGAPTVAALADAVGVQRANDQRARDAELARLLDEIETGE